MTAEVWLADLVSCWVQIGVITTVAALLLRMRPMRSPGTALAYLQALLGVCLLLPAVEPWRVAPASTGFSERAVSVLHVSTTGAEPFSAAKLLLAVLAVGIGAGLIWLFIGYARLRGYRRLARRYATEALPGALAEVYISSEVSGPVTFG